MNAKEKAIKQIQKEVMSSEDMMEKFVEEIADEENLYCRAVDIALEEQAQQIFNGFNKLWSCLKFEKRKSKVIGYTFDKGDMDKFKRHLSTFSEKKKRHNSQTIQSAIEIPYKDDKEYRKHCREVKKFIDKAY